ncbi:TIGR04255 family protein [Vibrio parahaemolyticus]|uniref:TIGR04255 family protein n=1 Tax=Vibrio parahaemolyticus TaxID=670 RepID=UPI0022B4A62F|nr:TIGR04255 family protein [Vibrio parahaemolyticus]MCZ5880127.1 TIGR04255 family protein [Vibrio parahaemolyticus]MCZ6371565.1 TIGR04255 family protein [Vibrio parahaemolyticus]
MKKVLEKAPLVHALIHLRFTDVPSLISLQPDLINKLHLRMIEEGFNEKIPSRAEIIEMEFDAVTQQARQKKIAKERLLFRAAGEKEIVEISESSLILKSTNYSSFKEFYDKFHRVLIGCQEVIDGFEKTLLKSVGIRYIDVVVPSNGRTLSDFVNSEIQPPQLLNTGKHLRGHSLKAIEVAANQVLIVNFEELPVHQRRVHKVLPDNLIEPDQNCGLIIDGQQDWGNVTSETYGILDIDHSYKFVGSPLFDSELVKESTEKLYKQASDIFWNVISHDAKDSWGYKEI